MRTHSAVLFISILLINNTFLFGQSCDCAQNLDSLASSIERNYAGFQDKVTNTTAYLSMKDSLLTSAQMAQGYDCYLLLQQYIHYFADPHLTLILYAPPNMGAYLDSVRKIFSKMEKTRENIDSLKTNYAKRSLDSIEGIWQALDFPFQIAIYKNHSPGKGKKYVGITLEGDNIKWYPGQRKMEIEMIGNEIRVTYFKGDHLPDTITANLHHNFLNLETYGKWVRIYPIAAPTNIPSTKRVSFSKITSSIGLLAIKDAALSTSKLLDSTITANYNTITKTPYLIIDLRNNPGGFIMAFDAVLPIIATKPIRRDGLYLRASHDNIDLYKETLDNPQFSDDDKVAYQEMIAAMEKNVGKIIRVGESDTLSFKGIAKYPKKVAIIVNHNTASAAELFVLMAKQSDKVIVAGTRTKGQLDYTEIGRARSLPCPYLKYYCPMGKGTHEIFPYIDNIGIEPDIITTTDPTDIKAMTEILTLKNK